MDEKTLYVVHTAMILGVLQLPTVPILVTDTGLPGGVAPDLCLLHMTTGIIKDDNNYAGHEKARFANMNSSLYIFYCQL